MSYGVVIISRDRAELLSPRIATWERQGLPVHLLTEPDQVGAYRRAVGDAATVIGHREADRGIGFARAASLELAEHLGYSAYVMADDDTVVTKGSDVRRALDFVARGVAINCGGWLSVHGLWFGKSELDGVPARKRDDAVVPHFGDKLYATNVRLAVAAGGYDVRPLADYDTAEWNRITTAAGYLWWVHAGVRIREIGAARAPGGINAWHEARDETRMAAREQAHRLIFERWPGYVSPPGTTFRVRSRDFVINHVGRDAYEALRTHRAYRDADPLIPRREIDSQGVLL